MCVNSRGDINLYASLRDKSISRYITVDGAGRVILAVCVLSFKFLWRIVMNENTEAACALVISPFPK